MKAIQGTGGIMTKIAIRAGCSRGALVWCIHNREGEDWDKVREVLKDEQERVIDDAESRIGDLIKQDEDRNVASATARWFLTKRRGYFSDKHTVVVEGGENPVKVEQTKGMVDIAALDLPVDVKRAVLEAIEKAQANTEDEE